MSQLSTFYPAPITAADLGLGPASNATFGSIQNTPIGNTTPNSGAFTTLDIADGTRTALPFFFRDDTDTGFYRRGNNTLTFVANGQNRFEISSGQIRLEVNSLLGWTFNDLSGSTDLALYRDAADTLAQRRATNPQTFRLYNTFTDASNHERGFMRWSSNVLQIGTEKAGTGSARALEFVVDGTTRVSINTSGVVSANAGVDVNTDVRLANGFGLTIAQNRGVFWTDGSTNSGTRDVFLGRFAARQLALRLGASDPMAFQIYNAYTSTTNFERLNLRWDSNQFIIDAEAGSAGGTLRGIKIGSATSSLLGFYGVTPVDQPATVADPAGGGTIDTEARTAIGEVIDRLQELGLIAT